MNFRFSEEEEGFRQEVWNFLDKELKPDWVSASTFHVFGSDHLWSACRQMAHKLSAKGWLTLGWPQEYGGHPNSLLKRVILFEEMAYRGAPGVDPFGVKMLAPILIAYGTPEQKHTHLPPIARGEVQWCQCFSEPDAGSDLASLKTTAKEDGDSFVINGQKVWTTAAHRADWCFMLARTDPQLARHKGLSFFLVNLKTPGVSVRPLNNLLGENCFNEVYFDEVRVPKADLVGKKNEGWYVAMSLEGFERSGIEHISECRRYLDRLIKFVNENEGRIPVDLDEARRKLVQIAVEVQVGRWLAYRVAWMQSIGKEVAYEAAMSKVFGSELMQRIGRVGMQIAGPYSQLLPETEYAPLNGELEQWYVGNLGRTIGGGTSEIQRTLIALRGLELPR